jgi:sodium transport system permease protein
VEFSEYGDLKVGSIGPGTARQTWLNRELQHKVSIDSMVPTDENFDEPHPAQPAARRPAASRRLGSPGRLARLCLKEWRETLRDRRTIVTLVLMPLLVYPLLSLLFQRFLITSLQTSARPVYVIGLNSKDALPFVQQYLDNGADLLERQQTVRDATVRSGAAATSAEPPGQRPQIQWYSLPGLERAVVEGQIDLAILLTPAPQDDASGGLAAASHCELIYRGNSALSQAAMEYVRDCFRAVNDDQLQQQAEALGVRLVLPATLQARAVSGTGAAVSLTTLIPLILILMTITGAVYPAIDLTAGERERGTLETLMAAPVPRLELLAAKYVAVLTVALLTAGANLLAMTVTLFSSGLGELVFGEAGLSPLVIVQVLGLLVLFAAFFSAILLALTSFARSFKEAQAYLIPIMLLSLAPGLLSLTPGLQFSVWLALTPLVNIVLLARDVFEGSVDPSMAVLAVCSTLMYAVAAIAVAARIFGTDALLYGSEGGWSDLISRPAKSREVASLPAAMFCVALLFPGSVLLTGFLRQQLHLPMGRLLLFNALATLVLFAGMPLAAAFLQRVRLATGFRVRPARLLALCAAAIWGLTLWPIAHEVFLLNQWLGLTTLTGEQMELVSRLLEQWRELSPWLILFSLALVPALCEELLFRGYLFAALQRATSAGRAIWVSALLFGLFHVVVGSPASPERFLPSTFLGLVLGWLAWRSGSVVPCILLHVCHNGLLLMLAYYRDALIERGWGVQEQQHLPATWLLASLLALAVGGGLLYLAGRPVCSTMPETPES